VLRFSTGILAGAAVIWPTWRSRDVVRGPAAAHFPATPFPTAPHFCPWDASARGVSGILKVAERPVREVPALKRIEVCDPS
jgi:hypothetical protein